MVLEEVVVVIVGRREEDEGRRVKTSGVHGGAVKSSVSSAGKKLFNFIL